MPVKKQRSSVSLQSAWAFSTAGLILVLLANMEPVLTFDVAGNTQSNLIVTALWASPGRGFFRSLQRVVDNGAEFELFPNESAARSTSPAIRIAFENGQGLLAGQTQLRYRGIPVGLVEKINPSNSNVGRGRCTPGARLRLPSEGNHQLLVRGGIAFATPDNPSMGPPVRSRHEFTLNKGPRREWMRWAPTLPPENGREIRPARDRPNVQVKAK